MKCYFFGTFNPIHNAHLEIANKIKEKYNFEEVVFVPAFAPAHKKDFASAKDRLKMAQLAAGKENVCDIEFKLPLPSYSYRTILELKKRDKTEKINFIIGYDAFFNIEKWAKPEILKENINFIIVPRSGEEAPKKQLENLANRGWNFEVAQIDFINISSSMIREKIAKNEDISPYVPKKVEEYINECGIYKRTIEKLPEQRAL